ncbi:DeoR/GlpR family DNA-binding transcription regulator [Rhodopseudomonas palustris]|uniref:DeoR/GlpR family DNA-binding transcription regulator n=1 Tax=Rhodopseudomonas palustris TaxID=1076 RepID=UPI0020CC687B|nr:DeoR/GlpR family DNA-binding transcription regulator [Rhodopseudomonas palustris]MCP9627461.1 DeoR/GlpR family DNA-binding transcription regulator [Rhodopseudomonas palustris]
MVSIPATADVEQLAGRKSRRADGDRLSKTARHQHIISQLTAAPTLRASELAAVLGVSTETIRRDLMELQEQKLINRTYGGASRPFALEPSLVDRKRLLIAEREAIAAAIGDLIQPNEVLMLGAGATTFHVARRLAATARDITVIVNDFAIAGALATNASIRILCCPGRYHATEGYVFGTQTIASINSYEANRAIVGATGVGARGINDADEEAGAVYGAMVKRAAEAIIVADHSKFEQRALTVFAQWSEIDRFVTDRAPEGALATAVREAGTELIVAPC